MKVRALQTLMLAAGTVLTLSEAQAARRRHLLKPLGGSRFEALGVVCFKAGEELGVDGDLPKALAEAVETDAPRAAKAPPRRKPAAPAPDDTARSLAG